MKGALLLSALILTFSKLAYSSKHSELRFACRLGNQEQVMNALERGGDISRGNSAGDNCLHLAALHDQWRIIKYLKELGISTKYFNSRNKLGRTPLHIASMNNNIQSVMELLDAQSRIDEKDNLGATPIYLAIEKAAFFTVIFLAAQGASLESQDINGNTPLHVASELDSALLLKALIWVNPKLDIKNKGGWTPLHVAAKMGNIPALEKLLSHHADINAKDFGGWTALHVAAYYNQESAVQILLQYNAALTLTYRHQSPAEIARLRKHEKLYKLLNKTLPHQDKTS